MQRRKGFSNHPREATVAANQSSKWLQCHKLKSIDREKYLSQVEKCLSQLLTLGEEGFPDLDHTLRVERPKIPNTRILT